jgi:hypothetical protein
LMGSVAPLPIGCVLMNAILLGSRWPLLL